VIGARYVGTRLAGKPFLISLLVIAVLAVVGFLSFHAVGNLVAVNREIATHTIPAVRLAASTREAITPLIRLEMRALVLADPGYATAWNERAVRRRRRSPSRTARRARAPKKSRRTSMR